MRLASRSSAVLALALALLLPACGDDAPAKKEGGGSKPGGAAGGGVSLGKKMPEFTPSGIKEDYDKVKDLHSSIKRPKNEEERNASKKALAELLPALCEKWAGKEVPAPEALMYAYILNESDKFNEAASQCRRYAEVAPPDGPNYTHAVSLLISSLASAGNYDEAVAELEKNSDTTYKNKDTERVSVSTGIALAMMHAGKVDKAGEYFEKVCTEGPGDVESVIYGVDCYLRIDRVQDALRVAEKGASFFKEGNFGERMRELVRQVNLVGKLAPDFSMIRDWVGEGGQVTQEMMAGKVTVVFFWNMQKQWNKWFFERLNKMNADLAPRGLILVGCSRLAHFDARKMATIKELSEEEEVAQVELYAKQESIHFSLAIGNYDPDTALLDAWAGHVVPSYVVVGKDGKVSYVRSGKDEDHIAVLREMVEKAMAK